jgi:hypothetical protein
MKFDRGTQVCENVEDPSTKRQERARLNNTQRSNKKGVLKGYRIKV